MIAIKAAKLNKNCRDYTNAARTILERQGYITYGIGHTGKQIIWRQDGKSRNLSIEYYDQDKTIVRLSVDQNILVSKRIANAFNIERTMGGDYGREVTVLPHETEATLKWLLVDDVRFFAMPTVPVPPPFGVSAPPDMANIWSVGAWDAIRLALR